MVKIDPMMNLVNTILDNKEIVFFIGAGASVEGIQNGKPFPSFEELMDRMLNKFDVTPNNSNQRKKCFFEIIKRWEIEKQLSIRLHEFLEGEPGTAHYMIAALSIALYGISNSLLYITTNFDNLLKKAFTDIERNPVRKFETVEFTIQPNIIGSQFQNVTQNIDGHLKAGHPVIVKLFGDISTQNPIFRQNEMRFEPEVEKFIHDWMSKPLVIIGYSFSDKKMEEFLLASRGVYPIFFVNPSLKKVPASIRAYIKKHDRIHHIESTFGTFISELINKIKMRKPQVGQNVDIILDSIRQSQPMFSYPREEENTKKDNILSQNQSFIGKKNKNLESSIKTILIFAANPKNTSRLRLDEEVSKIEEGLKRAKYRDRFKIISKWAVTHNDLRRGLLDYNPQIVQFIGHGTEEGILLEDEIILAALVSVNPLSELFQLFTKSLECVILSACYSETLANALSKHIKYVIGMKQKVKDRASIEFSVGFYDALGAGRSIEDAFKFGRQAILQVYPDIEEHLIPVLKCNVDSVRNEFPAHANPIPSNDNYEGGFRTLINERTKDFVGRKFIFNEIDLYMNDICFPSGYIVIKGEPGIGKTALSAQLVKERNYIHHFNIKAQRIDSIEQFYSNICNQLIVRFKMDYSISDHQKNSNSNFFSQLIDEIAAKKENLPLVILVDALDEVEHKNLPPGTNNLFLPSTLPEHVYIILTTREMENYHLLVDNRKDILLCDDPNTRADARSYIMNFVNRYQHQLDSRILEWGINKEQFGDVLTEKSRGNFMYLIHVLKDIRDEKISSVDIDDIRKLPIGLKEYYAYHWSLMQKRGKEKFENIYKKVACLIATQKIPLSITLLSYLSGISSAEIIEAINEWREFLHSEQIGLEEVKYSIYHYSFQEFLKTYVGLTESHHVIHKKLKEKIKTQK